MTMVLFYNDNYIYTLFLHNNETPMAVSVGIRGCQLCEAMKIYSDCFVPRIVK